MAAKHDHLGRPVPMNGAGADASFDDRYRQMRRVTLIGAAVNIRVSNVAASGTA